MSSREVLNQYLLGNQLTDAFTLEEFQKIVSKSLGKEFGTVVTREKVQEWYEAYQEHDRMERESIASRVDQTLGKIERDELLNLESVQLKESFTLEELVDNLYTVDQVMDSKLEMLNSRFESSAAVFNQLSDILVKSNQAKRESDMNLVDTLAEYKDMLQTDE